MLMILKLRLDAAEMGDIKFVSLLSESTSLRAHCHVTGAGSLGYKGSNPNLSKVRYNGIPEELTKATIPSSG